MNMDCHQAKLFEGSISQDNMELVANKALKETHVVLGRTVEVKKTIPRSEQQQQNTSSGDYNRRKKIFVGGLSSGISEEEFKNYFEKFGRITDVVVMQDTVTHRPRGFGFITFDSEESVDEVLVKNFHDLNGKQVEVKRVIPKENHGFGGINKLRYKKGKTVSLESLPPKYILPGHAPPPWYNSNGLYVHASNAYGSWYLMDEYGGNGWAVPYDPYRNIWYGFIVPITQACQEPCAYFSPSPYFLV